MNLLKISNKIREAVIIRSLLFIIIVAAVRAQQLVPSWFQSLPEHEQINIAVGYTGRYRDRELARQAALNQARKNLAKQLKIRLIFEIQEMSDGYYRLIQPTFEEIYFENIKVYVDTHSQVLDSAYLDNRYYILLANSKNIEFDSIENGWGAKPSWTDQIPQSDNYVYGVGIVANYSYWKNGWQDADGYARFDACKNLRIQTASIRARNRMDNHSMHRKILKQSIDITVANSRIIERWYDIQRDVFYSLCRIPISNQ